MMAIYHDEGVDESRLVILDAQNFSDEPVAEVIMPQRVPYSAHGNWMPG